MRRTRISLALSALAAVGIMFVGTGCGSDAPAPAPSTPVAEAFSDRMVVVVTDDGKFTTGLQQFYTDQPALVLSLGIFNYGGGSFKSSPLDGKLVTLMSVKREDQTSAMKLGSVMMDKEETALYGGNIIVKLPLGTYALVIDGVSSGEIIKVSAKAATPASSPMVTPTS